MNVSDYAQRWRVTIESVSETLTSHIAYGRRGADHVVLKISKTRGDEADSGAVAAAFASHGMVRVLEHERGAALLERLTPGTPLTELVTAGEDERATDALAEVIAAMSSANSSVAGFPTVEQWGSAFARYIDSADEQIPRNLVLDAEARYRRLCSTQRNARLLHGDLQHYNILADHTRGWVAIDPKGVVGELEFELSAALRNPHDIPELYSSTAVVERRVRQLTAALELDEERVFEWAYAAGVLSAIWSVEDHGVVASDDPALCLVRALRSLVSHD